MKHVVCFCAFVLLCVCLSGTGVVSSATLDEALAAKENAVHELANTATELYASRCQNMNRCRGRPWLCSIPGCGNDFPVEKGFTCSNEFGTDASLCGSNCNGTVVSTQDTTVFFPRVMAANASARGDGEVEAFFCATQHMTPEFIRLHGAKTLNSWSYIADFSGAFRLYPGVPRSRTPAECSNYDPRRRPWYLAATDGPKDVVIMIDISATMRRTVDGTGGKTRLDLAKSAAKHLLEDLDADDFVGVVAYSSDASVLSNSADALQRAEDSDIAPVKGKIDALTATGASTTSYTKAMEAGFKLFQGKNSANCTRVVVMLTDSAPTETTEAVVGSIDTQQSKLTGKKARFFVYRLSPSGEQKTAEAVACATEGITAERSLASLDFAREFKEYYAFLAAGIQDTTVRWTDPYIDAFTGLPMVTASRSLYDDNRFHLGVVAADVMLSELEEIGGASYQQVIDALQQRTATCPERHMSACQLKALQTGAGFHCPTTATLDCTAAANNYTNISKQEHCPVLGDLNEYLCTPLKYPSMLPLSVDPKADKDVMCCDKETCPSSLWIGPTEPPTSNECENKKMLIVIVTNLVTSLEKGLTSVLLNQAIDPYVQELLNRTTNCFAETVLLDSKGSPTGALAAYKAEINDKWKLFGNSASSFTRIIVVILDNAEVTGAFQSSLPASIPIVSAWGADTSSTEAVVNDNTLRMLPSAAVQATALISAANAFKWDSVAIVYSGSKRGTFFEQTLQDLLVTIGSQAQAPVAVSSQVMPDFILGDEDEKLLQSIADTNPVGVFCLVSAEEFRRLVEARRKLSGTDKIVAKYFFLGLSDALDGLNEEAMSMSLAFPPPYGFPSYVPFQGQYSKLTNLKLALLLDTLNAVTRGARTGATDGSMSFIKRLTLVKFTGFTGTIAFNDDTLSRTADSSVLHFSVLGAAKEAGTWTSARGFIPSSIGALVVPPSPLKTVTVCMLATGSCYDQSNLKRIMYGLLQANRNRPYMLSEGVKFNWLAMNTGADGVQGMRLLLKKVTQCNFVTGPGRSLITFALTPIFNAFTLPQLDYIGTASTLSDKVRYPYYSRVLPDDVPLARAYAEVVSYFRWDRIAVLTTTDEYGTDITAALRSQMEYKLVDIEEPVQAVRPFDYRSSVVDIASYTTTVLNNTQLNTYLAPLTLLRDTFITRIVAAMIPSSDFHAKLFFDTVVALGMHKTHIFLLHPTLCQAAKASPELRIPLVGSICAEPGFNRTLFAAVQSMLNRVSMSDQTKFNRALKEGEFSYEKCKGNIMPDTFAAYAHDVSQVLVDVVERALKAEISLTNATALVRLLRDTKGIPYEVSFINRTVEPDRPLIRPGELMSLSGNLTFSAEGNRLAARYTFNVQQQYNTTAVVEFGNWSSTGMFLAHADEDLPYGPLHWLDNTTNVPKVTLRSLGFIASSTVHAHPGAIVLSLFGFVITIGVFCFCYRSHKTEFSVNTAADMVGVAAPSVQ